MCVCVYTHIYIHIYVNTYIHLPDFCSVLCTYSRLMLVGQGLLRQCFSTMNVAVNHLRRLSKCRFSFSNLHFHIASPGTTFQVAKSQGH